jgi:hypothetical protein
MVFARSRRVHGEARFHGVCDKEQRNAETQQDAKEIGRRHAQRSSSVDRDERERQ